MHRPRSAVARACCAPLLLAAVVAGPARGQDEPAEVAAVRAKIDEYRAALEAIRGEKFQRPVDVRYQTPEDFRAFVMKGIDAQLPPEKAAREAKLLAAVGLVAPDADLRAEVLEAVASQAAAYYDPEQGAFFILKSDMPMDMLAPTVVHELHHALQDQRFDLKTRMAAFEGADFDREDDGTAFKYLIEGEATFIMLKYQLEQMGQGAMLEMALRMQAGLDRKTMDRMERMQAQQMGPAGKGMVESLDARARLSNYLYHGLIDPYFQGAAFVLDVWKKGGWKAVDELFERPPVSTEQALHPEKAWGPDRDDPVRIELPDVSGALGAGWTRIARNELGEHNLRVMFRNLTGSAQEAAAAGWDGDRICAYAREGDAWAAFTWVLVMDTEQDAKELAAALEKAKKGKAPAPLAGAKVTVEGTKLTVLGGVPADKLAAVEAALAAETTITDE